MSNNNPINMIQCQSYMNMIFFFFLILNFLIKNNHFNVYVNGRKKILTSYLLDYHLEYFFVYISPHYLYKLYICSFQFVSDQDIIEHRFNMNSKVPAEPGSVSKGNFVSYLPNCPNLTRCGAGGVHKVMSTRCAHF